MKCDVSPGISKGSDFGGSVSRPLQGLLVALMAGAWGLVGVSPAPASAATPTYSVLDLGTLGGNASNGFGINASGQVVGCSDKASGSPAAYCSASALAFETKPNSAINPANSAIGSFGSQANGINTSGQAAGFFTLVIGGSQYTHAFRTEANQPINQSTDDLGTLGGGPYLNSAATAVNSSGQVVGYSDLNFTENAFRTAPNAAINPATDNLGTLGGSRSYAYGINDTGQAVGYSDLTGDAAQHAFRTAANAAINPTTDDLGTLGGTYSYAYGINASGQVVGSSDTSASGGKVHAFVTAANASINPPIDDLGTLGGPTSQADAINSSGQIVGKSDYIAGFSNFPDAFFWSKATGMVDLNQQVPSTAKISLSEATAINDSGQIVANGTNKSNSTGAVHAYLLTPAPAVIASQTGTSNGQQATASVGGTGPNEPGSYTATAFGSSGSVTVASYAGDPVPGTPPPSGRNYFDVKISPGNTLSSVAIVDCTLGAGTTVYWYDGSTWKPASPQSANTPKSGCSTVTVTGSSSPDLSKLTGTPFASGAAGGPTAARVNGFRVTRRGGSVVVRWRSVTTSALRGFELSVDGRLLNHRLISVLTGGNYRYTTRARVSGRIVLLGLLADGRVVPLARSRRIT